MTQTTPTPGQPLSEADVSLLQPGDWLRDSARRLCRFDHLMRPDYIWARIGQGASCGGGVGTFTFLGRPDQDGWIAWSGGENPVPGVRVDVRFRDGDIRLNDQHSDKRWRHDPTIFLHVHIVAYRPHAPVSRPGDRVEGARYSDEQIKAACVAFLRAEGSDPFSVLYRGAWCGSFPHQTGPERWTFKVEAMKAALESALTPPAEPASRPAGEGEREAVARLEDVLDRLNYEHVRYMMRVGGLTPWIEEFKDSIRSALLSPAAPDAGGWTADKLTSAVSDETMRHLLSAKDVGSGRARLASILNALQPGGER